MIRFKVTTEQGVKEITDKKLEKKIAEVLDFTFIDEPISYKKIKELNIELEKKFSELSFKSIKRELFAYCVKNEKKSFEMLEELKDYIESEKLNKIESFLKKNKDEFKLDINFDEEFYLIFKYNRPTETYFNNLLIIFNDILQDISKEYEEIDKSEYLGYYTDKNIFTIKDLLINNVFYNWFNEINNNISDYKYPFRKKNFKETLSFYTFINQISDTKLSELEKKANIKFVLPEIKNIKTLKNNELEKQILFNYNVTSFELYELKRNGEHRIMISSVSLEKKITYYSYQNKYGNERTYFQNKYVDNDFLNEIEKVFKIKLCRHFNENYNFLENIKRKDRFDEIDLFEKEKLRRIIITSMLIILEEQDNEFLLMDAEDIIDDNIGQDFIIKRTQDYNCELEVIIDIFEKAKASILNELPNLVKRSSDYNLIEPKDIKNQLMKILIK